MEGYYGEGAQPYLQPWKRKWRVRKPIPRRFSRYSAERPISDRGLKTPNRAEADRLSIPVVAEFEEMTSLRSEANGPRSGREVELVAYQWRSWVANRDPQHGTRGFDPVFSGEAEFRASVRAYLAAEYPSIKPGTKNFETVMGFARGEAKVEGRSCSPPARRTSPNQWESRPATRRVSVLGVDWKTWARQQVARKTRG